MGDAPCPHIVVSDTGNTCGSTAAPVRTNADCIAFASTAAARGPPGTGVGGEGTCTYGTVDGTSYVSGCEGCGGS